ncbi:MAG: type II CRISPR-associated endonuclease Cas1 [Bdellovibrionota bacterium]
MNRIIDISTTKTHLSIFNGCLLVEQPQLSSSVSIPLPDILVVIVATDAASLTHAVLSELATAGIPYIACDRKYMPSGILLPYSSNSLQGERFLKQIEFKNQSILWREIILGKLKNTAAVLNLWGRSPDFQYAMIEKIKAGSDINLCEAMAAKDSFSRLFGIEFSRRDDGFHENSKLNYGYTVLRSLVARFVCASGLHPTLGVYHHNKYNSFALADDFMEPFRPFIDHLVLEILNNGNRGVNLEREDKLHLSGGILARWICNDQSRTLVNWVELTVRAWAQYIFSFQEKPMAAPLFEKPENFDTGELFEE